jgi:SAM-dependent methyltransferase
MNTPNPTPAPVNPRELFGEIDIYLFDQLLKGRLQPGMRILDAGCGHGRNLRYFFTHGFEVCGVDTAPAAIEHLRSAAQRLSATSQPENFRAEPVEQLSFGDAHFDFVICNAVLHFARDEAHFEQMLQQLWRVLKREGILFIRLASTIGIETRVQSIEGRGRWFHLPDGSDRFLVDEALLLSWTQRLGAELLEPIKTVNVQNMRCMTTWVLRKR